MTKSILAETRKKLMQSGASEAEVLASGDVQELFDNIQNLRMEMMVAKKEAADKAVAPYLETIEAAEKQYALMVKLMARKN